MFTPVVIIGGGHAGLAMSRRLTERSIDHLVVERGEVANSWRTERWDSLRLLTPNWHAALPGGAPHPDPHGFMTAADVARRIQAYATDVAAPVIAHTTVTRVSGRGEGYEVATDQGVWRCSAVVLATGAAAAPVVPASVAGLPQSIVSLTAHTYRNPSALPSGGVLVVGGSATGLQLAEELHASGRPVTLSVGEHVRMPRRYRGRDVFWWLETAGTLDQRYDTVDDLIRARHLPSPQLIGTPEHRTLDLTTLARRGVRVTGRLGRISAGVAQFSGGLANVCQLADLKLARLLRTFDATATRLGIDDDLGAPEDVTPTVLGAPPVTELDLVRAGIRSVVWATGLRPDHRWLDLPVFDHAGRLRHDGGVVAPGLYALGLPLLRRRRSSYLGGAAADTDELAGILHRHLDDQASVGRMPRPAAS